MKKWTRWFFHGDSSLFGGGFFCRNCNGFYPQEHFHGCNPSQHETQLELSKRELNESPDRWHPEATRNLFNLPSQKPHRGNPGNKSFTKGIKQLVIMF